MTKEIFDRKAEKAKLAKQYDSCTGTELILIKKTDPGLYERLCEAKGIVHGYPVAKDFQDRQTPERLISVEAAKATSRFSKEDVRRYYTQSVGNADNLANMAKNSPEDYRLLKLARETYKSLEPVESQLNRRIRPTEPGPGTEPQEHYSRLTPPAVADTESENTSVGELLGSKLNLPPETRVSFKAYSDLLLFVAAADAAKAAS